MKKLLCLLLASLSVGVNAMDSESELSKVQVFTSDNEYGKIETNAYYEILYWGHSIYLYV